MEASNTPQSRSARKTKRSSPSEALDSFLRSTKRLMKFSENADNAGSVRGDAGSSSNESLETHPDVIPPSVEVKSSTCHGGDVKCSSCGDSLKAAIEDALSATIADKFLSLSESVRHITDGQARLEKCSAAVESLATRIENTVRTICARQDKLESDLLKLDALMSTTVKRLDAVEESAAFLSNEVDSAKSEREKLARKFVQRPEK